MLKASGIYTKAIPREGISGTPEYISTINQDVQIEPKIVSSVAFIPTVAAIEDDHHHYRPRNGYEEDKQCPSMGQLPSLLTFNRINAGWQHKVARATFGNRGQETLSEPPEDTSSDGEETEREEEPLEPVPQESSGDQTVSPGSSAADAELTMDRIPLRERADGRNEDPANGLTAARQEQPGTDPGANLNSGPPADVSPDRQQRSSTRAAGPPDRLEPSTLVVTKTPASARTTTPTPGASRRRTRGARTRREVALRDYEDGVEIVDTTRGGSGMDY